VDDIDRTLLRVLRNNARASYAELARLVRLSAPAVHDRVNKLESSGVITGYHAAIAPSLLGKSVSALIGVFITDSADTDQIALDLSAQPAVEDCWFVAGEETFIVKASVPDVAGLEALIRALNSVDGVARTRTTVVLSTKIEDRLH
jgi:Lrp/AsnC family transcriptional regulator, leucine-responsive regulatory protein